MRRRKITIDYHVAPPRPDDLSISGTDFAKAIKKFADDNLAGALEVEIIGESDGTVSASPIMAAHTIKMLLGHAAADELIRMTISLRDTASIEISLGTKMGAQVISEIIDFPKSAGFNVERRERSLILSCELRYTEILKVYAISAEDFAEELKKHIQM